MIQDIVWGIRGSNSTRVKTRCGRAEYFEVKVGLRQGSMIFADDLVVVSETVEEELERWTAVIENKGFSTQFQQIIY